MERDPPVRNREAGGRHTPSPGRQTTLLYISQRWDRDVGGRGGPDRYRRFGDDQPLYAFEPLTHTDWVVSTDPRDTARDRGCGDVGRFHFPKPPQPPSFWLSRQRTVETALAPGQAWEGRKENAIDRT